MAHPKTVIIGLPVALIGGFLGGKLMGGVESTENLTDPPKSTLLTPELVGGIAGGSLGTYYGPQIFTSLEPSTARVLGGLGGGLLGILGGVAIK